MKKLIFIIFLVSFNLSFGQTIERQVVSSSGDSFSGQYFQIDFSIGEIVTETFSNQYYTITQGFHQNNLGTSDIEVLKTNESVKIYPNPTCDFVNIEFKNNFISGNSCIIELSNVQGKVLERTELIYKPKFQFYMNYPQGIYFLKIYEQDKVLGNFKIMKLN